MDTPLSDVRRQIHLDNTARCPHESAVALHWQKLGKRIAPRFYPVLDELELGQPARHPLKVLDRTYMASPSSIEFAAMASTLVPMLEARNIGSVIEIGGGYGGLASAVLRSTYSIARWHVLEIPSVARLARAYLAGFPRAGVFTYGYDLELLAPVGAVVQTRGFMEMSEAELDYYFRWIQGGALLPGGILYTVNRLRKRTEMARWPWDRKWRVLQARPWVERQKRMLELVLERSSTESPELAEVLVCG